LECRGKVVAEKCTKFHTYKLREKRSHRAVLKNMHYSISPEEIKTEIEKLEHWSQISGILNNTELSYHSPRFFVELEPALNKKDMFYVEYIQQCKIKVEPPRHKRDIAHCANCQRYGHTKNCCHLKLRRIKCAGNHLTNQCH
jgi:hypothetical protein